MKRPSKDKVLEVLSEVNDLDLPDGAHWTLCHERLGMEYGDLFPLMDKYGLLKPVSQTGEGA